MRMVSPRLRALLAEAVAPLVTEVHQLRDETVETMRTTMRLEFDEIHRMLRQQGDASDEVAETLGRTLVRLSAEVEALSEAVDRLESDRRGDAEPRSAIRPVDAPT